MNESVQNAFRFIAIVRRLLVLEGFSVTDYLDDNAPDRGFDFLATRDGETWATEVKYYRTERAQPPLIETAAARLPNEGSEEIAARGMLIVSSVLPSPLRDTIETRHGILVVDRLDLFITGATDPELLSELETLLESDSAAPNDRVRSRLARGNVERLRKRGQSKKIQKGAELCGQLKDLVRGRKTWPKYESLCEKSIRYLFSNDLEGWYRQKRTDDGLNRFDFVCRIKPTTEFWRFLIHHLDSRYVLFEFKNYSGPIKQGQILTTEKYLFDKGLRRVAIVFSRGDADKGARVMIGGAMREQGRLMLIVNDEWLCKMLTRRDKGEDPSDLLFDLTDNFLLSLAR